MEIFIIQANMRKRRIDLYDEVCIQHRETGYFKWFHLG